MLDLRSDARSEIRVQISDLRSDGNRPRGLARGKAQRPWGSDASWNIAKGSILDYCSEGWGEPPEREVKTSCVLGGTDRAHECNLPCGRAETYESNAIPHTCHLPLISS